MNKIINSLKNKFFLSLPTNSSKILLNHWNTTTFNNTKKMEFQNNFIEDFNCCLNKKGRRVKKKHARRRFGRAVNLRRC